MDTMPLPLNANTEGSVLNGGASDPPARHSRWRPVWLSIVCVVAILAMATAAGAITGIIFDRLTGVDQPRAYAVGELQALTTARLAFVLGMFQLVVMLGVWFCARRFLREGYQLLPLRMPTWSVATLIFSIIGLFGLAGLYGAAVYQVDQQAIAQDLSPFAEMMRTDSWWMMLLAAGIGAPVAEEFMFRGLLYGMLREAPFGKIVAALVSAAAWSMMHLNYAMYGLIAIFLIGLYFAWLREKTGSLLPPMVCHAVYNSLIVLALRASPDALAGVTN